MNSTSEAKWFLQHNGKVQGPLSPESLNAAIQGLGFENSNKALVWSRGLAEWVKADQWNQMDKSQFTTPNFAPNPNLNQNLSPNPKSAQHAVQGSMEQRDYSRDHVEEEATRLSPQLSPQAKYIEEELTQAPPSVSQPAQEKHELANDENNQVTAVANTTLLEKTKAQAFTEGVFYRVKLNYIDQPLMSKNELMALVAKQKDITKVLIQDTKTKEWKDVYKYPEILERLGLSRRQLPRVLIMAQFSGKSTNSTENVSYRVINISQSGIGFTDNFDLRIGDEVEGQISSPHFFQPLNIKAEVVYAGQDGYIGLKFTQIPDEALASIIDYVKKYSKNPANIA